jgi:hypothetical protein
VHEDKKVDLWILNIRKQYEEFSLNDSRACPTRLPARSEENLTQFRSSKPSPSWENF